MLSNFGRADGGRETWAYNFVPRLLARYPALQLKIYGLRVEGEPDNSEAVLSWAAPTTRERLSVEFVRAAARRRPNAFAFWRGLPKLASSSDVAPAFVLAVGSWVELFAVLLSRRFRSSGKLVWLRSIFADEKAHRYPSFLRLLLERVELYVLRRADVVIANGEDTADHYRALGLQVQVIPNAVDVDRWRMSPPALTAPINVIYVGRLAQVKGIEEYLALAKSLASDRFCFHIAGEGPADAAVADAASDDWLHAHGPVANAAMPALLNQMDVCAQLGFAGRQRHSITGGSGVSNALLEQAAAGRVLVCWDNPAYRQVLDDTSCYFVPQGDMDALKSALSRIIDSPDDARSKALAAVQVASVYSFDRHMYLFDQGVAPWMPAHTERM